MLKVFKPIGFVETLFKSKCNLDISRTKLLNFSLAFILKHIETKELKQYYSSFNNTQMLKTVLLISIRRKSLELLNLITEESFFDGLTDPHIKSKVV